MSNQVVAAVFYGSAATIGGLSYNLVWWYGAHWAKLTRPELSPTVRRAHTLAWGVAPVIGAIFTIIAFFSPGLAVAGFLVLVFAYVLPLPRLLALAKREQRAASSSLRR